jgi:hypothetical protein
MAARQFGPINPNFRWPQRTSSKHIGQLYPAALLARLEFGNVGACGPFGPIALGTVFGGPDRYPGA